MPPSPSLLAPGPAPGVGRAPPSQGLLGTEIHVLGLFLDPVLCFVSLFFCLFPPPNNSWALCPRTCTGEVMPDTFLSLDKTLDARVVPMESALGPGMDAPGRGGSRGRMRSGAAAPTCPSLLPSWGGGSAQGSAPHTPRAGDTAATILG